MSAERDAGLAALQQGDAATAIASLESANQREPNDYQTLLYLAAAYGKAERHTEAVTAMTSAVQLQPSNAQARYNLGVSYELAGWKPEALTAMQQAIQLQPNSPQAQEAIHRLRSAALPPPSAPPAAPMQQNQSAYGLNAPPSYGAPAPQPGYSPAPMQNQPAPYGANPQMTASPYGANPQAQSPYGAPQPAYQQPAPYGQTAPPYGSQPQPPAQYGASGYPPQMPNPGGYGAPNLPQGAYSPQSYQAYNTPAPKGSMATGIMLTIGLTLLCGIGVGWFTLATGMRFPFLALVFGFLFGWFVPKVCGGHGQAQGYLAGAGAGIASVAAIGVAYALGAFVSPLIFLFAAIAINRGYVLAGGGDN